MKRLILDLMSSRAVRILLSVVIIGGSLGAVMITTLRDDARYYKYVDEVMGEPQAWYGKPMKLHGYVADPRKKAGTLDYWFIVKRGDHSVPVTYTGFVPDNFKDGAEVILTGTLGPEGFKVERDGIVGKCPSKYEEQKAVGPRGSY
jgi:cytochrome c-type biogenesis protein CcmE